jgi:hypothetical protein
MSDEKWSAPLDKVHLSVPANWYVIRSNAALGPYTADEMDSMAKDGRLTASHIVRYGEHGTWRRAGLYRDLRFPSRVRDALAFVKRHRIGFAAGFATVAMCIAVYRFASQPPAAIEPPTPVAVEPAPVEPVAIAEPAKPALPYPNVPPFPGVTSSMSGVYKSRFVETLRLPVNGGFTFQTLHNTDHDALIGSSQRPGTFIYIAHSAERVLWVMVMITKTTESTDEDIRAAVKYLAVICNQLFMDSQSVFDSLAEMIQKPGPQKPLPFTWERKRIAFSRDAAGFNYFEFQRAN